MIFVATFFDEQSKPVRIYECPDHGQWDLPSHGRLEKRDDDARIPIGAIVD